MSTRSSWLCALLAGAAFSAARAQDANTVDCPLADAMLGTWEYLEPLWPGRSVMVRNGNQYLYVFVQTRPDRGVTGTPQSDAEKAAAYSTALAGAWEARCDGPRLKWRPLFALNPSQVGRELTMEVTFEGDLARFWFIRSDGSRGNGGVARRVRPATSAAPPSDPDALRGLR